MSIGLTGQHYSPGMQHAAPCDRGLEQILLKVPHPDHDSAVRINAVYFGHDGHPVFDFEPADILRH